MELTNHDPWLKLTINCKAETIYSFSQRRMNLTSQTKQLLFLDSNLAIKPLYSRSVETKRYKINIRIELV